MAEAEGAGGGGAAAGGAGRGRGINDALLAGFMGDVLVPPCSLSRRTAAAQATGVVRRRQTRRKLLSATCPPAGARQGGVAPVYSL